MSFEFTYWSPKQNLIGVGVSFDWGYKLLTFAFVICFLEIDFRSKIENANN